jgi:hypothetical protein
MGPHNQNGVKYQPQLRSKTPTTDRLLFQHTLASSNGPNSNSDYIFLNENQSQHSKNNFNELYSTVNGNAKTKDTIINDSPLPTPQSASSSTTQQQKIVHVPIYDSTTNIQHQKVQQNLNKFNHNHTQNQIYGNHQQLYNQTSMPNGITNRSKTPGPDIIYFHNNNNNNDLLPSTNGTSTTYQSNYGKAATLSAATAQSQYGINQFNYMNRSKTPTADIMYYPSSSTSTKYQNYSNMNGGQASKRSNKHLFENIYQPFNQPEDRDLQENDHYMDTNNFTTNSQHFNSTLMKQSLTSDVDGNFYTEMVIDLYRQETGFGFRIVGGEEEGSQVSVGYIVSNGAAHVDGRLRPNDEIIMIDNECVLGATHRRVVQLMTIAGLNRQVKLRIRRKLTSQQYNKLLLKQQQQQQQQFQQYPNTITLFRNGNEGFGFVIISTINKTGPSIGNLHGLKDFASLKSTLFTF